ncbi:MAG: hypothetical protein EBS53_12335, partial [Bacteroidetes bacterium]|nr:hypothetical protein [Bacteroidota bacterium]
FHENNSLGNGSARVTVTGGRSRMYSYLWSNGDTTPFVAGLTQGLYYVHVSDGSCSKTTYIQVNNHPQATSMDVVAAEYFFNADPGVGAGQPFIVSHGAQAGGFGTISTDSLTPGVHILSVRVRNAQGEWGHTRSQYIFISDTFQRVRPSRPAIQAISYFIDNEPGVYASPQLPVSPPVQALQGSFAIPVGNISLGSHRLAVRVQDDNGAWSTVQTAEFFNCQPPDRPVASSDAVLCTGDTLRLEVLQRSAGTIRWMGPNGFVSNQEVLEIPQAGTHHSGMYLIQIEGSTDCWSMPDTVWVRVDTMPVISGPILGANLICQRDRVVNFTLPAVATAQTFSWDIPTGTAILAGNNSPGIALDFSGWTGNYDSIRVSVSNACGQVVSSYHYVRRDTTTLAGTISPLTDTSVCVGTPVLLQSTTPPSGFRLQWMRNGQVIPGADRVHYAPTQSGLYQVEWINPSNCGNISANGIQVSIHPYPSAVVSVSGTTTLCGNQTISLTGGQVLGAAYQWLLNGNPVAGLTTRAIQVSQGGNYQLVVTTGSGCRDTSLTIPVNQLLGATAQLAINGLDVVCPGQSVQLVGTLLPNVVYRWMLDGQILPGQTGRILVATVPGVYRVIVSNAQVSCSDTSANFVLRSGQAITTQLSAQACSGSGFLFGGIYHYASGTYTATLTAASGCDSVVTLNLTVGRDTTVNVPVSVCAPQSYVFGGQALSVSGSYTRLFTTALGCDSFVVLQLDVRPVRPVQVRQVQVCAPTQYSFAGQLLSASGTYTDTLVDAYGCDSVEVLQLTVLNCNHISGMVSYLNRFATPINMGMVRLVQGSVAVDSVVSDAQGRFSFSGMSNQTPYRFAVTTQKPWGGVNAT